MNKKLYTTDAYGRTSDTGRPELEEQDVTLGGRAQKSYERFFAGYTEYHTIAPNGKHGKTVREYTGELYRQELTAKQSRNVRLRFALASIVAAALYLAAMILPTHSNYYWYVVLISLVPAIFYTKMLLAAGTYAFSSQDMKIREYREVVLARPKTIKLLLGSLLLALVFTICILIFRSEVFSVLELIRALLLVASGLIVLMLNKVESCISYKMIPGKTIDLKDDVAFCEKT